jgi:Adenylosuccinate synthase
MFPDLSVDMDAEIARYKNYAEQLRPLVVETVSYLHTALSQGKHILVEGERGILNAQCVGREGHPVVKFCSQNQ